MRVLEFQVEHQVLTKARDCDFNNIVAGSVGYLYAKFDFVGDGWDGHDKMAVFFGGGNEVVVGLDGAGMCSIPAAILVHETFHVAVMGVGSGSKLITKKIAVKQELIDIPDIDAPTEGTTLVVDSDLRRIIIPPDVKHLGVEFDDGVLNLKFQIPRYYSNFDLSTFDIRINYVNAAGDGDVYFVKDITVEDDMITFYWLVSRFAAAVKGDVIFNVCLKKIEGEGENAVVVQEFNTIVATLPVLEGLETTEQIVQEYPDLVEKWQEELFGRFSGRVDPGLSTAGMAADARATGERLASLGRSISSPYKFKGSTTFNGLPSSGNEINDTYYCTDLKCKYSWNGSAWCQSSMTESDYADELGLLSYEIDDYFRPLALQPIQIYRDTMLLSNGSLRENIVGKDVKEYAISPGQTYYFSHVNDGRDGTHFYDADFNSISTYTDLYEHYGQLCTVPDNAYYVRYFTTDEFEDLIIPESVYAQYGEKKSIANPTVHVGHAEVADRLSDILPVEATTFADKYMVYNLHNPEAIAQEGVYCNFKDGVLTDNATYCVTDKIRIREGQTLRFMDENSNPALLRMVASFAADGTHIGGAENVTQYTQSGEEAYLIVSLRIASEKNVMISDSAAVKYVAYGDGEYVSPKYIELDVYNSNGAYTSRMDTMSSGERFTASEFPRYLKNAQAFSFFGKFNSFTSFRIGKGYQEYRGHWLDIDATTITHHRFENEDAIVETIEHGLTFSDFIAISMDIHGEDCNVVVNTAAGQIVHKFNWQCEACGALFIETGSEMTGVVLNATSETFEKKMWMFGDSYYGVNNERVIGQLRNLGYFDELLIDGLAGINSPASFNELERCLKFGSPKYLIWGLGMNDDDASYGRSLASLESLCQNRGIELILTKIPNVPVRDKTGINAMVEASSRRYVDSYLAVGSDSSGNWYSGYLSGDEVHPTELGARALAMQILMDVPEIMRY